MHSIPPTFDEHSRVLVLGSFPSPKSREGQFNYGHPQNRFWRVLAQLAGEELPTTNDEKRSFCLRHGIALWDVIAECDIEGASDTSIRNAKPNKLSLITGHAPIEAAQAWVRARVWAPGYAAALHQPRQCSLWHGSTA